MSIEGVALFGSSVIFGSILLRRNKRKRTDERPPIPRSPFGTLLVSGDKLSIPLSSGWCGGARCELLIRNDFGDNCVLMWVDENGLIPGGYRLVNGGSINDGSVSNTHIEFTFPFHSFIILRECAQGYPKQLSDVTAEMLLCSYRPEVGQKRHILHIEQNAGVVIVGVSTVPLRDKSELIDTAAKHYDSCVMSGFTVNFEPGVFDKHPYLLDRIERDLSMVANLLPALPLELLQSTTIIWLNHKLLYGYVSEPVVGRGCCYHPHNGQEWLRNNGMSIEKCSCIEIYDASDYLKDIDLWGSGGVLVHELSHAYHNKYCKDGYDNYEVDKAYRVAMELGLYNEVNVHGAQGQRGSTKAYACANRMEFFAELSVAYMCEDGTCEYNKWFPFNRHQLIDHDLATFNVIDRLWKEPHLE